MITKIAWKNIWRNKMRSTVVIGAIALGVWAVLFLNSLSSGITRAYVNDSVMFNLSHIQIHNPDYLNERKLSNDFQVDLESLSDKPAIKFWSDRMLVDGMVSSSRGAQGVTIRGVDIDKENDIIQLASMIVDGNYLSQEGRNPVIIGKKLAEKLDVKVRQKIVLTFQSKSGDIVAGSFRIQGIYRAKNAQVESANVYIRKSDLARIAEVESTHEVAILLNENEDLSLVHGQLKSNYPNQTVRTYKEISPDMELYDSQIKVSQTIVMIIVMLALIFGIINTMMMAVLERIRELGMLMAIGMNKIKVFLMIVMETIMLGIVGAPLGMFLGWITLKYFGKHGIDLSQYSAGMREFGMTEMLYPYLEKELFVELAIAVFVTAFIASIFPALKAIRLRPVEAIRTI